MLFNVLHSPRWDCVREFGRIQWDGVGTREETHTDNIRTTQLAIPKQFCEDKTAVYGIVHSSLMTLKCLTNSLAYKLILIDVQPEYGM